MAGFVTDWRRRELLQIRTVCELLDCSRSFVYDRLMDGQLQAHHPSGEPGRKGLRVTKTSVVAYIERGQIDPDSYKE